MKLSKIWAAAAAMVALSGAAQAGLVLQSNGVEVLDTDTNLLWLYDWNSSGKKNWGDAKLWAAGLTVGGATAGDWRLPEIGEYADLWTDVGSSLSGLQSQFTGVQYFGYWSGTEHAESSLPTDPPVCAVRLRVAALRPRVAARPCVDSAVDLRSQRAVSASL